MSLSSARKILATTADLDPAVRQAPQEEGRKAELSAAVQKDRCRAAVGTVPFKSAPGVKEARSRKTRGRGRNSRREVGRATFELDPHDE